ncbi:MAG TPA: hypothetical protein VFT85_02755 [Acidimicrobiia bacterium]|nr:hypothetical protein [Acidimicrobiia bacterium]
MKTGAAEVLVVGTVVVVDVDVVVEVEVVVVETMVEVVAGDAPVAEHPTIKSEINRTLRTPRPFCAFVTGWGLRPERQDGLTAQTLERPTT